MEFDLRNVELSRYDIRRGITLPKKPSKELAEFIGILAGDGHVSFNRMSNKIYVVGNSITDWEYCGQYIKELIRKLFSINPTFTKKRGANAVFLTVYSKGFVSFMQVIGYYKCKTEIRIPDWIINNHVYMTHFTRGLFDTDGCVFVSDKKGKPRYPCIELTTTNFKLAQNIKNFLEKRNFRVPKIRSYYYAHSSNASYKVSLYGYANLSKWIKDIRFSNKYKLNRALGYEKQNGTAGI